MQNVKKGAKVLQTREIRIQFFDEKLLMITNYWVIY